LEVDAPVAAVELTAPRFWRTPSPSATFHGRDVFAPVAAHLSRGVTLESLGSPIHPEGLVELELSVWTIVPGAAEGAVQTVDRFGNLISSVPGTALAGRPVWSASVAGQTVAGHRTYGDVAPGEPLALVGSHGFVELAVRGGDARKTLGARTGDRVEIRWT